MFSSVLVLAPHADDETLIAGGLVHRTVREGGTALCLVVNPETPEREAEATKACITLGASLRCGPPVPEGLDTVPLRQVLLLIELAIEEFKPECVVLPARGSHQDHKVTHDAGVIATRPSGATGAHRPPWVLVGEEPSDGWPPGLHLPRALTVMLKWRDVEMKIAAMECHASQMRPPPSERSLEQIEAVANVRGQQAGFRYGEAFAILRAAM